MVLHALKLIPDSSLSLNSFANLRNFTVLAHSTGFDIFSPLDCSGEGGCESTLLPRVAIEFCVVLSKLVETVEKEGMYLLRAKSIMNRSCSCGTLRCFAYLKKIIMRM